VTLSAYDHFWNLIGQVVAADQPGQNHLALSGNPGNAKPIKYVRLQGSQSNAAINIKNLMQFSWD
jgi:hypothetical protein